MKSLIYKSSIFLLAICAVSCFSPDERNYQYFPNMYESEAYEAYQEYPVFPNSQEAMLPVEGTIPRGWMPYSYPDTPEGYQAAKANLENPLPYTEEYANEGEALYTIYCAICHGDKGDGKGTLAQREKILGIPAYNAPGRDITAGSAYHVMYYGRNTMGSYAAQTTTEERWKIAMHVIDLKRALNGLPPREYEIKDTTEIEMPTIMFSEGKDNFDVYQETPSELDFTIHEESVSERVTDEEVEQKVEKLEEVDQ